MKIIILNDQNNQVRNFSANAIRAANGKHSYSVVASTDNVDFDYVLKFKQDIVIVNAQSFVNILEQTLNGQSFVNQDIEVIGKELNEVYNLPPSIEFTYKRKVDKDFDKWYDDHLNPKNCFWAYNSEKLDLPGNEQYDTIVCVGAGLIPLYLSSRIEGRGTLCVVDINPNCLEFQKKLFDNLDSVKSILAYDSFVQNYAYQKSIEPLGRLLDPTNLNNIFSSSIDNIQIKYIETDLRVPSKEITDLLQQSKKPLVYFSNIFSYTPTLLDGNSEKDFVLFLNILLGSNLNVKWHGDSYERFPATNLEKRGHDAYCWKQPIDLPYEDFMKEVLALEEQNLFVPHRTKDGHNGVYFNHGWHSFCVHGIGYDMTQGHEHYGYTDQTAPYDYTKEALEHCPKMVQWFKDKKFKNRYHRVRIMKLEPGGIVGFHNDNPNPKSFATNMAINNPPDCEMHFYDRNYQYLGIVPWQAGDVFKIQIGLNHYVINKSNENRYHFIIHGEGGYI